MRSDLTVTAGRFWSPHSIWNREAQPPRRLAKLPESMDAPLILMTGSLSPTVLYVGQNDPEREVVGLGVRRIPSLLATFQGRRPLITVDFESRSVMSASAWRRDESNRWTAEDLDETSLDDEGWGSLAAGLVLEREMLRGRIEHAVGCLLPRRDLYGTRLWPRGTVRLKFNSVEAEILRATTRYGMICVGVADRPMILIEKSLMAATPNDPGRTYRGFGLGNGEYESSLRLGLFRVET